MIEMRNVSFGYGETALFNSLSCAFEDGKLTCVVGNANRLSSFVYITT